MKTAHLRLQEQRVVRPAGPDGGAEDRERRRRRPDRDRHDLQRRRGTAGKLRNGFQVYAS